MPEVALHFAVPFALTAPFLGVRKAILVSLIALLPDLDVLLHVHRSASHSLIVLAAVSLVAVGLVRAARPSLVGLASVASLALLSHPVMDVFTTYTPILYPLLGESLYLSVEAGVLIGSTMQPTADIGVNIEPTSFENFEHINAPLFTSEGFIVSLLLVAMPFLAVVTRDLMVRRAKKSRKAKAR